MDNFEKLMNEIKAMDKNKKNELLDTLDSALSDSQKKKLKKMVTAKSGKAELESHLENVDINKLLSNASSKEDLLKFIDKPDVKAKINEILG